MNKNQKIVILLAMIIALPLCVSARMLHLDAQKGSDKNDGLTASTALCTLKGLVDANIVKPGDEIILHPGVYFVSKLPIAFKGTEKEPIIIRADKVEHQRVILTGADSSIRAGKTPWMLEDADIGLYSVPCNAGPSRVLYSGTDLFPYESLELMRRFVSIVQEKTPRHPAGDNPGPRHGFFWDKEKKKLYVRLHASGKYGSTDPNKHLMAVSRIGHLQMTDLGEAHIVIEGISFEAMGPSAILTSKSSHVTVRRCWFRGCPSAVRGGDNITVAYCDWTQFPAYDDAMEMLQEFEVSEFKEGTLGLIWQRKTDMLGCATTDYEDGMLLRMGNNWEVHHNYLHNIVDGLSIAGMSDSVGARIHDNIFERLCDNAIETEAHAKDAHIYRNVFLNTLDTFSCQVGGVPFPGPIYFYQNVILNTREHSARWAYSNKIGSAVFKIGISVKTWKDGKNPDLPKTGLTAPEPGWLFFNNTICFQDGQIFNPLGNPKEPIANVRFENNLFVSNYLAIASIEKTGKELVTPERFQFRNNLVAAATEGKPGPGATGAGEGGRVLANVGAMGWMDFEKRNFALKPVSPAIGKGLEVKSSPVKAFRDIGAIQAGDTWYPLKVGPLATEESH